MHVLLSQEAYDSLQDRNDLLDLPTENIWYRDDIFPNFVFKAIVNKYGNNYHWQCFKREPVS